MRIMRGMRTVGCALFMLAAGYLLGAVSGRDAHAQTAASECDATRAAALNIAWSMYVRSNSTESPVTYVSQRAQQLLNGSSYAGVPPTSCRY